MPANPDPVSRAGRGRSGRPDPQAARAGELIDHARQLADRQVTVYLMAPGRAVQLRTLIADQLLHLQAGDDPAS